MTLPIQQLQQAVLSYLRNDTSVSAICNNVYDRVPNRASAPYISLGTTLCRDQSTLAKQQFECELSLQTLSRARDNEDGDVLLDAIHTSLENAALTLSGYRLFSSRFVNATSDRSADGQRVEGEIFFQFVIEKN